MICREICFFPYTSLIQFYYFFITQLLLQINNVSEDIRYILSVLLTQ